MKDTDYLFLSAKLRAMENNLLTAGRMERMIDAPTAAEAARVLSEIGYGEFSPDSESALSEALAAEREKTFEELRHFMPDHSVIDVFRVKYDYHNLKAVLKAQAMGLPCEGLLIDAGRVDPKALLEALREGDYAGLPEELAAAAQEAAEVLGTTKDPQRSDFVLDRAYYREMLRCAEETGSAFLRRYVHAGGRRNHPSRAGDSGGIGKRFGRALPDYRAACRRGIRHCGHSGREPHRF